LDRGPDCVVRVSSNLLRSANFSLFSGHRHFCANLLNLSKFRCRVKPRFRGNQDYNSSSAAGRFSCLFDRHSGGSIHPQKVALRKNFKQQPALIASRISRAQEDSPPGSCNGFVLCGIPYRGWMLKSLIRPTNRLPTSLYSSLAALERAGPKATGRLHCSSATF
jgi:hypothetical protein